MSKFASQNYDRWKFRNDSEDFIYSLETGEAVDRMVYTSQDFETAFQKVIKNREPDSEFYDFFTSKEIYEKFLEISVVKKFKNANNTLGNNWLNVMDSFIAKVYGCVNKWLILEKIPSEIAVIDLYLNKDKTTQETYSIFPKELQKLVISYLYDSMPQTYQEVLDSYVDLPLSEGLSGALTYNEFIELS